MSKHTPGPWHYQEDSDKYTHIVRADGNLFLCQLAQTTTGESKANARLIAAAPEMKAILQEMYDDPYVSMSMDQQNRTKAILAKATGPPARPRP